jgi:hypothetical protein
MAQHRMSPEQAKRDVQHAAQEARPWLERFGRFGYAAKGVVYALVGVLAVQEAFGRGGKTTGTEGALQAIARPPFGQFLLGVVAVGLVGYALWRFIQAIMDTENKGTHAKGIVTRGGYVVIGLIYAGLAVSAVRLIMGSGGGGSGEASTQGWTARLLSQPFGQWLVGIVGAVVIGIGLYQFYQAYSAKFREELNSVEMSSSEETWATWIGRFGFAARGVVFGIIGGFLIIAAIQAQPQEARGLGGALQTLVQQLYGPWLLGIVAIGLVAYGLFMFVLARYRRMVMT